MKAAPPNRLLERRNMAGYSRARLAKAVKTTSSQIQRLESGERKLTAEWRRRLSAPLNCRPMDLLPANSLDLDDDTVIRAATHLLAQIIPALVILEPKDLSDLDIRLNGLVRRAGLYLIENIENLRGQNELTSEHRTTVFQRIASDTVRLAIESQRVTADEIESRLPGFLLDIDPGLEHAKNPRDLAKIGFDKRCETIFEAVREQLPDIGDLAMDRVGRIFKRSAKAGKVAARLIPAVGRVSVGPWVSVASKAQPVDLSNPDNILSFKVISAGAFALEVTEFTATGKFKAGDRIVVDPTAKPARGRYIVVKRRFAREYEGQILLGRIKSIEECGYDLEPKILYENVGRIVHLRAYNRTAYAMEFQAAAQNRFRTARSKTYFDYLGTVVERIPKATDG